MKQTDALVKDHSFYAQLAVTHATDSIVVTGADGRFEWVNSAFQVMTGYTMDEVQGQKPGDILQGPDTDNETTTKIRTALQNRKPIRCEIYNYTKHGEGYWIELSISPIFDDSGQHTHFMAVERDVTDRRKLEEQAAAFLEKETLHQNERRILNQMSEWLHASKTMEELLTVTRKAMQAILPEASGHLYIYANSRDTLDLMSNWGSEKGSAHFSPDDCWSMRRGRAYSFGTRDIEFTCSHVHRDDSPYFCMPIIAYGEAIGLLHLHFSAVMLADEEPARLIEWLGNRWNTALLCVEQISLAMANVRLRTELMEQSVRDQLTGLWNRRWFLDTARREFGRAQRSNKPFTLISLDVDHFKMFNDHHGHEAGDHVLREVGALMYKIFGANMLPCRVGGEEFIVICPDMTVDDGLVAAERFRLAIQEIELKSDSGRLPPVTVSQGVAGSPADAQNLAELIKCADEALYAAKAAGRNCSKSFPSR